MTDVHRWTLDPVSVATLLLSAFLYAAGAFRLRRVSATGQSVRTWAIACFWIGWIALVVALVSPVATLSDFLFSVHMTQHEILMLVAAPLLVLSRPLGVFVWAFPEKGRHGIGRWTRRPAVARAWRIATGAITVWILHGAALWIWHLPRLYQAAVENTAIHAAMHVCFLFTAALFWWAVLRGRYGRLGYGMGIVFVFTTGLHSTILGALLTLAPRSWYGIYRARAPRLGVDPLADQQLGGLLMWVPFGVVFMIIGLALLLAWLGEAERRVRYTSIGGVLAVALLIGSTVGCNREAELQASMWTGGFPARGKVAVRRYGCVTCHTIPGVPGADGLVGPPLDRMASRAYIAGRLTNTPQNLMGFVKHPHGVEGRIAMPEMGIPDRDVRDIAAYLYTLK